ncbi:flagellar M-ring protein FliF [Betaproteobacteria bacterium GR16-43]|nr:flagellar M-ring protein FliF [Betaproteobacteria bacterium GR16-43]
MSTALTEAAMPTPVPFGGVMQRLNRIPPRAMVTLMIGLAALAAIVAAGVMWSRTADYRVLFANVGDKDGGAIVAALSQMNVPYKYTEGGGAIMVPSDKVHDTRLKLASQGLPKGGTVGFELMDNQKLGVTQFQEQVNYQRGLEGELSKSIMSLAAVQNARVHLAMPRPSVFMRDSEKPSASVLVQLHPGRSLDRAQVAGIVHLVSASVPELPVKNVSVVDQNGSLLSSGDTSTPGRLDATQLAYIREIEAATIKRIEDILGPVLGAGNVRAQVTADVDFSLTESTAETWKPNQDPAAASVRSSQTRETGSAAQKGPQGVPGATSNQPGAQPAAANAATAATNGNATRDATVNYELDKTVKVTRAPVGAVKRLSAAVVVNHRKLVADGKTTMAPLAKEELEQINNLVKEAMGFQEARKDSLNVVNAAFTVVEREVVPEVPMWKQPETISLAKEAGSAIGLGLLALFVFFGVIRPAIRAVAAGAATPEPAALGAPMAAELLASPDARRDRTQAVREIAKQDPKVVANVVKNWVGGGEA